MPKIRTPAPLGGVRATGVSLSASYDRGEANGVWADLSAHQITGKNVADNQRQRLMAGYYYKLINEDNRRLSIGLNTMLWHYQKDLSGYSLGQGGYYSPQQYLSLSLPVNYRQRTENWSWELGGSVSLSHSKTDSQRRYPLQGLIPDSLPDKFAVEDGSASSGVGYTLRAIVERRLSSHWTLGAGIDIQQAKDYTPSHALIYLRYSRPAGGRSRFAAATADALRRLQVTGRERFECRTPGVLLPCVRVAFVRFRKD